MRVLLTLLLVLGIPLDAAAQRRPVAIDDQFRLHGRRQPRDLPRWRVDSLHADDDGCRSRSAQHRHLESEVGRFGTHAADVLSPRTRTRRTGARTASTSRSCRRGLGPRKARRSGCSIGPAARRVSSRSCRAASRATTGRPTASGWRIVRRHGGDDALTTGRRGPWCGAPAAEADRHRQISVQARRSRPISPATPATASSAVRHRHAEGRAADGRQQCERRLRREQPAWSPDGSRIAFVSNHDDNWDRTRNSDVFVVDAKPGSPSRRADDVCWADGGRRRQPGMESRRDVDCLRSGQRAEVQLPQPEPAGGRGVEGGAPRVLTETLDRGMRGRVLQRRREEPLSSPSPTIARSIWRECRSTGGKIERTRRRPARRSASRRSRRGGSVVTSGTSTEPAELYAVEGRRCAS